MRQIIEDENQLKEVFKQAFAELLQERRDLLYDVFSEVHEDIALVNTILVNTIKEGEVFQIVESES